MGWMHKRVTKNIDILVNNVKYYSKGNIIEAKELEYGNTIGRKLFVILFSWCKKIVTIISFGGSYVNIDGKWRY